MGSGWYSAPHLKLSKKSFFEYFLGAAHVSLSVAKLWSASEVQKVGACQGALLLGFSRFFEKNRVKLLILRTFLCHFNASADSYVSAKLVFRQSAVPVDFDRVRFVRYRHLPQRGEEGGKFRRRIAVVRTGGSACPEGVIGPGRRPRKRRTPGRLSASPSPRRL